MRCCDDPGEIVQSGGSRVPNSVDERRPRSFAPGRQCAVEGCNTLLSRYNPSDVCCLHHGWAREYPPSRSHKGREELTCSCQNPRCAREFVTTNPAKKYCCDRCRMQAFQGRVTAERSRGAARAGP